MLSVPVSGLGPVSWATYSVDHSGGKFVSWATTQNPQVLPETFAHKQTVKCKKTLPQYLEYSALNTWSLWRPCRNWTNLACSQVSMTSFLHNTVAGFHNVSTQQKCFCKTETFAISKHSTAVITGKVLRPVPEEFLIVVCIQIRTDAKFGKIYYSFAPKVGILKIYI